MYQIMKIKTDYVVYILENTDNHQRFKTKPKTTVVTQVQTELTSYQDQLGSMGQSELW